MKFINALISQKTPHSARLKISTALVCFLAAMLTLETFAQRGAPRGGGAKALKHVKLHHLGSTRNKFEAFQHLHLQGAAYYAKNNPRLRKLHLQTYQLIRNSLVEDRIDEQTGRDALEELIKIGQSALETLGDKETLTKDEVTSVTAKLKALNQRIKDARTVKVEAETLTPKINKSQLLMEEIYLFGTMEDIISDGKANTLRRHLSSLENKEDRAKNDNNISDREREKLAAEAVDAWKFFVRAFKA